MVPLLQQSLSSLLTMLKMMMMMITIRMTITVTITIIIIIIIIIVIMMIVMITPKAFQLMMTQVHAGQEPTFFEHGSNSQSEINLHYSHRSKISQVMHHCHMSHRWKAAQAARG